MARRGRNRKARGALRPPPGLYDPALDAALGAAQRGYGDYTADVNRDFGDGYSGGRAGHDYQLGRQDIQRNRTRVIGGLDIGIGRTTQDYNRAVSDLGRNYQQLGRREAEGARHSGVLSGGLAARAAAIRGANQAHDRAPLDTSFSRAKQDYTSARTRAEEDTQLGLGRLGLGYDRQVQDAQTGLYRAGRENQQFGLDTNASRVFQATQAGWDPSIVGQDAFAAQQAQVGGQEQRSLAYARGRRRRGRGLLGTARNFSYGASF